MNDVMLELLDYLEKTKASGKAFRAWHQVRQYQADVFEVDTLDKKYRFRKELDNSFSLVVFTRTDMPYKQKISETEYEKLRKAFFGN